MNIRKIIREETQKVLNEKMVETTYTFTSAMSVPDAIKYIKQNVGAFNEFNPDNLKLLMQLDKFVQIIVETSSERFFAIFVAGMNISVSDIEKINKKLKADEIDSLNIPFHSFIYSTNILPTKNWIRIWWD